MGDFVFENMIDISDKLLIACLLLFFLRRTILKNLKAKHMLVMWIPVLAAFLYPKGFIIQIEKTIQLNPTDIQISDFILDYTVLEKAGLVNDIVFELNWKDMFFYLWIAGVIAGAMLFLIRQIQLRRIIADCNPISDPDFFELLQELDFPVKCLEYPGGAGAAITCSFPSVLLIFENSVHLNRTQKSMLLLHEQIHWEKHHVLLQLIIKLLKIIWWFHLGIWVLEREVSKELEFYCDEVLMEEKDVCLKEYAELMLLTQSGLNTQYQLGLSDKAKGTKERIEKCMIKKKKHYFIGTMAFVLLTGFLLFQFEETIRAQTDNKLIEVKGESIELEKDYNKLKEKITELKYEYEKTKNEYADKNISIAVDGLLSSMVRPVEHAKITCGFGCYVGHQETDVMNTENRNGNVYSVLDGVVISCEYNSEQGNIIVIEHDLGIQSHYHHLDEQYVQIGDIIEKGECIGTIGQTGIATGAHLGFGVTINGDSINTDGLFR